MIKKIKLKGKRKYLTKYKFLKLKKKRRLTKLNPRNYKNRRQKRIHKSKWKS